MKKKNKKNQKYIKKRRGVNYNTQEEREHRLQDKPRRGRQYDRQSGTGRGKEVSKGGAGGKGTWGDNPKNIAKNYENYNDDDYYFESALNPEKKKERHETYVILSVGIAASANLEGTNFNGTYLTPESMQC